MSLAIRLAPMLALAAAAGCRTGSPSAPPVPRTNAYIVTLGRDTIAVDQYTRVGDRIEGTLVTRAPRTTVTRYQVALDAAGRPLTAESMVRLPDGTLVPGAPRGVTVTYGGDSAVTRVQRDTVAELRSAAAGAFPYINYAVASFQLPLDAMRAMRRDTLAAAILPVGGRTLTPLTIRRRAADRYVAELFGYAYDLRTDDRGSVQAVDGTGTTQQFLITRRNALDVAAIASAWAERERQTRALGLLSPRDTAIGVVGSDTIWIDYGRPSARGRQLFAANGILNDTLWRTGANAATQLWTRRPIRLANQTVPAGRYSLWTLAVPGRYQLIVNKQAGQWGTIYDPRQDLLRVPLAMVSLPEHVERFTILVDTGATGTGALRLRWGTTELSVPLAVPE